MTGGVDSCFYFKFRLSYRSAGEDSDNCADIGHATLPMSIFNGRLKFKNVFFNIFDLTMRKV